jgi:hypothetical protein
MKTYLNNQINKSSIKSAILAILACDLLNLYYIKSFFIENFIVGSYLPILLKAQGIDISRADPTYMKELTQIMSTSLFTALSIYFIYQLFMGMMGIKKKAWALKYFKGYSLSTFILCSLELIFSISELTKWHAILAISVIFYFFAYLVIKKKRVQ